jgi:hypothetical protein
MSNEPVAWMHVQGNFEEPSHRQLHEFEIMRGWKQYPLYTHPIDDTALLRQALSTLEGWANYGKWVWPESALEQAKRNTEEAITALRERLGEKT